MITIRVLSADDWMLWRELRLAALADAPDAFGSTLADWQGPGDREERWRQRLAIPGSCNIVATLDNWSAGMASGVPDPDGRTAELLSMWVAPGARGRGVGDALVRSVVDWARRRGTGVVMLAVAEGNEVAAALYRRHGFTATGVTELMPDGVRREIILARRL